MRNLGVPRNYLRVRGEYVDRLEKAMGDLELPPRARRIRVAVAGQGINLGTTSACAENTPRPRSGDTARWNYLRVRGEYFTYWCGAFHAGELPPRARRILFVSQGVDAKNGTTSACAENTLA